MKKQFEEHIIEEGFFGQEINMTNFNLARMNMFLHNVNYNNFSIKRGDTLLNPLHMKRSLLMLLFLIDHILLNG
ncbi:N-6 DNA methylase [Fusobacterium gonidiaformans]|uniref:N-6 DNA methylase n=1 Tax=Fusobacterium gonidiaformans TaxID=849 RepID=UPI00307D292F